MATSDPLKDKLVTVLGGSGFLGRYVAQALLKRGARLRVASRNPEQAFSLKPLADLGQIQTGRCDITDPRQVASALAGADGVVNLVGSFSGDQKALMGDAAGQVAEAARAAGARALVHLSAIGADEQSPAVYGQAKALGEKLVMQGFAQATILRPSVLFAEDDGFINMFAGLIEALPVLPVFAPHACLQPVFADDVAEAVAIALADPASHGGRTYELAGPATMSMIELNRRIAAAQHRRRHFIAMPDMASALFAAMPLTPMSRDQWALLKQGNCASGRFPGFEALGITPRPLELFLDKWMERYRQHGRFSS
ncbi:MAG: complex I NDUFA9 subunit family protein [Erythrobacter sp.]|nr:complex I NDUFA9 subunit family protein [Erythrobacter sp.]